MFCKTPSLHTAIPTVISRTGWAQGKRFKDSKKDSKIMKNLRTAMLSIQANVSGRGDPTRRHGRARTQEAS